ncbi:MAG: hypothetical protein HC780_21175 [Leptolyngbyaceae cyanobacterium CSU_1_3]|nr:hypothetical protein [Leptolyngbyaceae cyanobacterium CSU_1_3]
MSRKQPVNAASWAVQLDLWSVLEMAEDVPEDADLEEIWMSLDTALEPLGVRSQLKLAGEAIARIAQLIQDRALLTIQEIHQLDQSDGPIMPAGAFDRFVRQSMQVNLTQFVEAPPIPPRLFQAVDQAEFPDDGRSVVVEVDQAALLEALEAEVEFVELETYEEAISLAYSENVQEWNYAIQQYFAAQPNSSISFLELIRAIQVRSEEVGGTRSVPVQTWLALLLGEYKLEQRGDFYQTETLWVTQE